MVLRYISDEEYISEFLDDYLYVISNKDFCSSPTSFRLKAGIDILTYQDFFCGIKIKLNKLDNLILEEILLLDNSDKISLADFIAEFV